jgi:hypothetical protein
MHDSEIHTEGSVSTIAGNSTVYLDGPVSIAKFEGITGKEVDKNKYIIVVDNDTRIRIVSATSFVATFVHRGSAGLLSITVLPIFWALRIMLITQW